MKNEKELNKGYHIDNFALKFDDVLIPKQIHLIPIGKWDHDMYGPMVITFSDIEQFVQNFDAGIRKGVFITAGHEGYQELPAVAWITKVEARGDGLWGFVEWNESGKALLADKAFKYFSPEFYPVYEDPETHEITKNVLSGGALTKSPYFKELEAVVFSEKNSDKKLNLNDKTMNLKDLLAKKKSELTAEEKTFLKNNTEKMDSAEKKAYDEMMDSEVDASQKKASENAGEEEPEAKTEEELAAEAEAAELAAKEAADAEAAKAAAEAEEAAKAEEQGRIDASEKVMVSAHELSMLRKKADEGALAFKELQTAKMNVAVGKLIFNDNSNKDGKFLPKSTDTLRAFMETLSDAQSAKFSALMNELPSALDAKFSEKGAEGAADGTSQAELDSKVELKLSENKGMGYSDALKLVLSENEGLEERYSRELPSARKANL